MKKGIILIIAMLGLSLLVGCSSNDVPNQDTTIEQENTEITNEYGDIIVNFDKEIVLVDNDMIKVVATGTMQDIIQDVQRANLLVTVENKTDELYGVSLNDASVGDKMSDVTFYVDVRGGKKADTEITYEDISDVSEFKNGVEGTFYITEPDGTYGELGKFEFITNID